MSYVQVRHLIFVSLSCFIVLGSVSTWLIAQSSSSDDPAPIAFYPVTANGTNVLLDSTTNHFNGYIPTNISVAYGPGPATNTEAIYISAGMAATVPQTNSFSESAFTFATWYRGSTNSQTVSSIASGSDVETNKWSLYSDANGVPHLAVSAPSGEAQVLSASSTNGLDVNDGYWHFLTGVVQMNSVELYVDNTESQTNVDWAGKQSSSMQVGSTNTTYSPFTVSDAQLFDTALTSTQVANVQNSIQPSAGSLNPATSSSSVGGESAEASPQVGGGIHPDTGGSNIFTIDTGDLNNGGNEQTVAAGAIASNPLDVLLTNSSGGAISGASIKFSIASGSDGELATSKTGSFATSQTVTTNSSGVATIYYEAGSDIIINNSITATDTADSLSVTFTEHCGTQSGLALWLNAGVGVTTSGGTVSNWADQSTYQNNVTGSGTTAPVVSTGVINGQPGIVFNGSQYLNRSSYTGLSSGGSDRTMIVVARYDGSSQYSGGVAYGAASNYQASFLGMSGDGTGDSYTGTYAAGADFGPPVEGTGYILQEVSLSSGTETAYLNGTSEGTSTFTWNTSASGILVIGAGINYVSVPQTICEVLAYNRALTSTERSNIEAYIGNKYGLCTPSATWYTQSPYLNYKAEILKNQWNETQAAAYITMQNNAPTTGVYPTGLVSWFDANTQTGANGSSVTSWTDGAVGNNVTAGGATNPVLDTSITTLNNKKAVRFNGQNWFYSPHTIGYGINSAALSGYNPGMTIITVAATTNPNGAEYSTWLGQAGLYPSGQARGIGYGNSLELADFDSYRGPGTQYARGSPSLGDWTTEEYTVNGLPNASNTIGFLQNGTTSLAGTISNPPPLTPGITIGAVNNSYIQPYTGTPIGWTGDIAEVLVYDHPLSSTEQASVGKYLGNKYGIYDPNATWYSTGYTAAEVLEIKKNQWSEAQANAYKTLQSNTSGVYPTGLISWFDASTQTGANGSSVTTWTDGAIGNTLTAGGATAPILETNDLNMKNAVRFNGQNWFYSPQSLATGVNTAAISGNNAGMTVITVAQNSQPGGGEYSAWLGGAGLTPSGQARGIGYSNSLELADFDSYRGPGTEYTSGSPSTADWATEEYTVTGLPGASNTIGFLQNGKTALSSSISNPPPLTSGITLGGVNNGYIQPYTNSHVGWTGDIAEVLVYDHPLSASEQALVGKYLGDKYHIYDPNATWIANEGYSTAVIQEVDKNQWNLAQANAYKTLQSNTSGVYPTGLISWFDASTQTGANGSSVTTWTDGAIGNTLTAGGATAPILETNDLNMKNAVRFNGQNWFYSPQSLATGVNTAAISGNSAGMTVITVAQNSQPGSGEYSAWLGNAGLYPSGQARGIGYSNSLELADFDSYRGPGTEYTSGSPSTADWATEEYTVTGLPGASNTIGFLQNGKTALSSSISNPPPLTSGITLGGVNNGYIQPYTNSHVGWTGDIAEVLVYDHPLSASEQASVGKYLGDKYHIYDPNATWIANEGYSTAVIQEVDKNQWNLAQANAYKTLQSNTSGVYPTGLISWFDASTLTGSNGSNVTTWTDGAIGNTVTAGGATVPTLETNDLYTKNAVRFNGQNWFYSPQSLATGVNTAAISGNNAGMTIITIARNSQPNSGQYSAWLGGAGLSPRGEARAIGYSNSSEFADFDSYYTSLNATGSPSTGNWANEQYTLTGLPGSSNAVGFLQNGKTSFSATVTPQSLTSGITLGGVNNGYIQPYSNSPVGWTGDIAEVLVYDHPLSSTEQAKVGAYLGNKYEIYDPNATWYNQSPFLANKSEILRNQWNEAQATSYNTLLSNTSGVVTAGLVSWFKEDSITGLANGASVSSWTDSALGIVATPSTSTPPTYVTNDIGGASAVRFTGGTQSLYSSASLAPSLAADSTIITVFTNLNPVIQTYSFWAGAQLKNTAHGVGFLNSRPLYDASSNNTSSGNTLLVGNTEIDAYELGAPLSGAQTVNFYQNSTGQPSGTSSLSNVLTGSTGVSIGGTPAGNGWWGDIAEVLVYDHQLSSTDLVTTYNYLNKKYGQLSFIPPSGTSASSSLSVTINVPAGATVYYTTDGSVPAVPSQALPTVYSGNLPNTDSPATKKYSGALTLVGSCPINAVAYNSSGLPISPVITAQYYVADTNKIGITDAWQTANVTGGLGFLTATTANNLSPGGGGLTYLQDYLLGYLPNDYSTNGDGLSDLLNYQAGYKGDNFHIRSATFTNLQLLQMGIDPLESTPYVAPTPTGGSGPALTIQITLPTGL